MTKAFSTMMVTATVALGLLTTDALLAASNDIVRAELIDSAGKKVGSAELKDAPDGVLIDLKLKDFPRGTHAMHVHEVGKCEPPFKTASGHFNPAGKQHGALNRQGKHAGDLPNIHVPQGGNLEIEVFASEVSLTGGKNRLLDADGSALVIHSGADDYRSDPAGDAGERIACAVIKR